MKRIHFNFLKKEKPKGLCCLYISPEKLVVTHALTHDEKPTITFLETKKYERGFLKSTLHDIVKKHNLNDMDCVWTLHHASYQLFLLDSPAVPEAEIALALRWQIKTLINFPAEEAVIEYFSVPSLLSSKKKIYTVVAKKAELQATADLIRDAGLNLQYIDISELSLRNITKLYDDTYCYLGLLIFNQDHIEFIVTREKNLLLARKLPLPPMTNTLSPSPLWLENLINEIRNSFTYCKGQQQHEESPSKLLMSTFIPEFETQLNALLTMPTEKLHIRTKINFEFIIPSDNYLPEEYLIAIGGALREKST